MLNSLAAGRRVADRALLAQGLAVGVAAALAGLVAGGPAAVAAGLAGAAMCLGTWLAARVALGGVVQRAGAAFGRLLAGLALKWLSVGAGLALVLGPLQLPALPALAGVVVAVVVFPVATNWLGRIERER
jgi:hypothetical protein